MKNKMDLTNQRFGRLTVIGENPEPYRSPSGSKMRRWDCLCDCGKQVTVLQSSLTGGRTKSCGCQLREKAASMYKDLKGKRFGKLIVIERAPLNKRRADGHKNGWLCKCDCGNMKVIPAGDLENGDTISCGCYSIQKFLERISKDGENCYGRFEGTKVVMIKPDIKLRKDNTSGIRGVYWRKQKQKWLALIGIQGRLINLGTFQNIEDAKKARKDAEEKYFAPIIERWNEEQKKKEEDLAC